MRDDNFIIKQQVKSCHVYKYLKLCKCLDIIYHNIIEKAITELIKSDEYLLKNNLNERTITHKLAEILQELLPEYNVDCEYNKNLKLPKTLDFNDIVNSIKKFLKDKRNKELMNNKLESYLDILYKELEEAQGLEDESGILSYLQLSSKDENKKYIKRVYPDIIAHLRGHKINKIVVEAKKETNKNKEARYFDLIKLGLFTQINGQYCYDIGYFIDFPNKIPSKFDIKITPKTIVSNSNVYIVEIIKKK